MAKVLFWIVMLPVAVAIIVFSAANGGPVTVNLWPLPYSADLPLAAVVLVSLALGFVWGALVAWVAGGRDRNDARAAARRARSAEQDAAMMRQRNERLEAAGRGGEAAPARDAAA